MEKNNSRLSTRRTAAESAEGAMSPRVRYAVDPLLDGRAFPTIMELDLEGTCHMLEVT